MFVVADEARGEAPKPMPGGVTRAPRPARAVELGERGRGALHYFEINVGPQSPAVALGGTSHTGRAILGGPY